MLAISLLNYKFGFKVHHTVKPEARALQLFQKLFPALPDLSSEIAVELALFYNILL